MKSLILAIDQGTTSTRAIAFECGDGDGLGVVAGGVGHHAPGLLLVGQPADAIPGPAEFEGPRPLQVFGLEQHATADMGVQGRAFDQRRAQGVAGDLAGGVLNAGEGGGVHGGT